MEMMKEKLEPDDYLVPVYCLDYYGDDGPLYVKGVTTLNKDNTPIKRFRKLKRKVKDLEKFLVKEPHCIWTLDVYTVLGSFVYAYDKEDGWILVHVE
jgi:hypothetical protein